MRSHLQLGCVLNLHRSNSRLSEDARDVRKKGFGWVTLKVFRFKKLRQTCITSFHT